MKKFWKWKNQKVLNQETQTEMVERILFLNGTIAEDSWFNDDVTPQMFKEELLDGSGDITATGVESGRKAGFAGVMGDLDEENNNNLT